MYFFKLLNVFGLLLFSFVQSKNEKECFSGSELDITGTAESVLSNILSGNNSIDPLSLKDMDFKIENFEIKLTNIRVSKLKTCNAKESLDTEKSTYDYDLKCSELVFTADATVKGCLGNIFVINGKDTVAVNANDYVVKIKGEYGFFTPKGSVSESFYLKDVIKMESKPEGKVTFKTNNNFGLSKLQATFAKIFMKRIIKKDVVVKDVETQIMNEVTTEILKAIDGYIRSVSAEDLLKESIYKEKEEL